MVKTDRQRQAVLDSNSRNTFIYFGIHTSSHCLYDITWSSHGTGTPPCPILIIEFRLSSPPNDHMSSDWGEPERAPPSVAAGRNVCLSVTYVVDACYVYVQMSMHWPAQTCT